MFTTSGPFVFGESLARLGRLDTVGRNTVSTPHYVAVSSRGTVPHITQDLLQEETNVEAIYAGVEDYVEHLPKTPPAYSVPCSADESPLRRFIALHDRPLLILGPRRIPALSPATPNTVTSMNISTATGFRQLEITDYIAACQKLKPDMAIAPMDYELGEGRPKPGSRRQDRMGERTLEWVRGTVSALASGRTEVRDKGRIWAPILPIDREMQAEYLEYLEETGATSLGGLVLYELRSRFIIPTPLDPLPRMTFTDPKNPQTVLRIINAGVDILTIPFVTRCTDAGIAFTFGFPAPESSTDKLPLGLNMWSEDLATAVAPLKAGCACYACRNHHCAYIRHLLNAKEMLAWTLLQVHNHYQMDLFFQAIRESIEEFEFERGLSDFIRTYEAEFPAGSGDGPRLRGYQIRIVQPGPPKANRPARRQLEKADMEAIEAAKALKEKAKLDDEAQRVGEAADAGLFAPEFEAAQLEEQGFGEKQ